METRGTFKKISMLGAIEITFELDPDTNLDSIDELINQDLDIIAVRHREKRSNDANAYFHVLVNKLARVMKSSDEEMKIRMNLQYGTIAKKDGTFCGVKVPKNTDIQSFYPYAKWIGEVEEAGKMFDKYLFYKRTSELDNAEMSKLIDGVVQECHEQGIETLPPAELKALKEAWGV
jgi:DNA-directed RNA polymerase delta subunit